MNEADYAKWLTTEIGVAVIPVSSVLPNPDAPSANHGLIRFCFAKQDDTLDEAIERLKSCEVDDSDKYSQKYPINMLCRADGQRMLVCF